jgi:competence protein ComEA
MSTTAQERLALGVAALLLAGGAGARLLAPEPPSAEWAVGAEGAEPAVAAVRERVEEEVAEDVRSSTPLAAGERIDPNRAPAAELERLPRIGPALAERIVEHREAHGAFRSLADLDAVPGFGPALLEAVAPHLTLPSAPAHTTSARDRLDLNRATAEELGALSGIGPVLARRIVEWRSTHGPFRSVEELEQVSGIGPKLRARLAPQLRTGL